MMGPSADGSGWSNINNTCQGDGCDQRMPLPKSHGKHCPKCGTKVPTWAEMQSGGRLPLATPAYMDPYPGKTCQSCKAKVKAGDNFCTECGTAIPASSESA